MKELSREELYKRIETLEEKNRELERIASNEIKLNLSLHESEELFRTISEQSLMAIVILQNGRFVYFNHTLCEMTGYTKAEIESWQENEFIKIVHPESREFIREQSVKRLKGDLDVKNQYKFKGLNKAGNSTWLEIRPTKINYKDKPAILFSLIDIDNLLKSQDTLKQTQKYQEEILNNIPHFVWFKDVYGKFLLVNKSYSNFVGIPVKDIIGKTDADIKSDLDQANRSINDDKIIINDRVKIHTEEFIDTPKGRLLIESIKAPVIDTDDNVIGTTGISIDITQFKKEQVRIKESEENFRNISEQSIMAIGIWQDNKIVYANEAFNCLADISSDEHHNTHYLDLVEEEYKENLAKSIDLLLNDKSKSIDRQVFKIISTKNKISWVDSFHRAITYNGKPAVLFGLLDVSEQRKISEEHKQQHLLIKNMLDSSPDGMLFLNKSGKIIDINSEGLNIFGFSEKHEAIGANFLNYIHENDIEKAKDNLRNIVDNKIIKNVEYQLNPKSEKEIYAEISTGIFYDSEENPIGSINVVKDVTKRKKAEIALRESEEHHKQLIEASPDTIILSNLKGTMIYISPRSKELFRIKDEREIIGNKLITLLDPSGHEKANKNLLKVFEEGSAGRNEYIMKRPDGSTFIGELSSVLIRDYKGNPNAYITIARDISLRKKSEAELITAKNRAEESDKLKSAFLANMSHEIRTPMNAIIGFSDLLSDPDADEESKSNYINLIKKSGDNLLMLIDDIIDIAKIEAGQLKIHKVETNLNHIFTEVEMIFSELIRRNNKSIGLFFEKNILNSTTIKTDGIRLKQILSNLINNAIKFTDTGHIKMICKLKDKNLQFCVEDTGIGIDLKDQKVIFDRFRQANGSSNRAFSGTGLGLAISQNLVKLLGGEMWLESEPGEGSKFWFTIPYNPILQDIDTVASRIKAQDYNWNGKTVVIAEDEENNYYLLQTFLRKTQINCLHARNGFEAVELAMQNSVDIVLMDIDMPGMDGFMATDQIKKKKPELPIIAQTAYAMEDDKVKCIEAGCDNFISKPIKRDILFRMMSNLLD